ncbi:MAG: hypothetical protein ACRC5C_02855 [Bacilli bacterium]
MSRVGRSGGFFYMDSLLGLFIVSMAISLFVVSLSGIRTYAQKASYAAVAEYYVYSFAIAELKGLPIADSPIVYGRKIKIEQTLTSICGVIEGEEDRVCMEKIAASPS